MATQIGKQKVDGLNVTESRRKMKQKETKDTVESMYGEYKICRNWLSIQDFYNLYPDVTLLQMAELEAIYNAEMERSNASTIHSD